MSSLKPITLPSTILDKPDGSHEVTIACFNFDRALVEFTDGSTCFIDFVETSIHLFWSKFFTLDQMLVGISDDQVNALKGEKLTAHVSNWECRGKTWRRVRFDRLVNT